MGKIGITCRQPFLGAVEWIAEEIKKAKGGDKDKQAGEKPAVAKEKKGEKK
jgi:DNA-directed RNA polymerase subunit E'